MSGLRWVLSVGSTVALLVTPANAAGVGTALKAAAQSAGYSSVGQLISGEIDGNTSNPKTDGKPGVTPSESPGPWACGDPGVDCSGLTLPGVSMGDIISPVTSGGNSNSNFANDKNPGPNFPDH